MSRSFEFSQKTTSASHILKVHFRLKTDADIEKDKILSKSAFDDYILTPIKMI